MASFQNKLACFDYIIIFAMRSILHLFPHHPTLSHSLAHLRAKGRKRGYLLRKYCLTKEFWFPDLINYYNRLQNQ